MVFRPRLIDRLRGGKDVVVYRPIDSKALEGSPVLANKVKAQETTRAKGIKKLALQKIPNVTLELPKFSVKTANANLVKASSPIPVTPVVPVKKNEK